MEISALNGYKPKLIAIQKKHINIILYVKNSTLTCIVYLHLSGKLDKRIDKSHATMERIGDNLSRQVKQITSNQHSQ